MRLFATLFVLSVAMLTVGAGQLHAFTVRIAADPKAQPSAEKISTICTDAGHTLAKPLDYQQALALKHDGILGDVEDLGERLAEADLLALIQGDQTRTVLELVDLASGSLVGAAIVNKDNIEKETKALLRVAEIRSASPQTLLDGAHGSWVQIRTRGHAKKGTPASVATKIATMTAKRNAVETILGSKVQLSELQDSKKVVAQARGALQYKVVAQDTDDLGPWVEIVAGVWVPQSVQDLAPAVPVHPQDSGFTPLVQKTPYGTVDWGQGIVRANGQSKIGKTSTLLSRRAAIVDAQANAVKLVQLLARNSQETIGEAAASNAQLDIKLKGIVQGAKVVSESKNKKIFSVEIEVPLFGVRGLQTAFHDVVPSADLQVGNEVGDEDEQGIIIDLRGTGSTAAMFPKVVEPDGTVVFDPEVDMDPHARQARGFAAYAIDTGTDGLWNKKWPVIFGQQQDGVLTLAYNSVTYDGAAVVNDGPTVLAKARAPRNQARRSSRGRVVRQGRNAKTVRGSPKGRLPTNIVFSTQKADKKAFYAKLQKSFRTGRVVILADTAIGGVEGANSKPTYALLPYLIR